MFKLAWNLNSLFFVLCLNYLFKTKELIENEIFLNTFFFNKKQKIN